MLPFELREHLFWQRMRRLGLDEVKSEVQLYTIKSCLVRGDEAKAERLLRDWNHGTKNQDRHNR
jgi:hypothetical protein